MESFSTRGMSTRRKLAYWNQLSSENFTAMEITPRDARAFDGELRRETIGPLTLMDVRSAAVRIRHTAAHVARVASPSYLLMMPLHGELHVRIADAPLQRLGTNEYCLIDHAQPYELDHGDEVRVVSLHIPWGALDPLLPRPERAVGRVMRGDTGVSRLPAVLLRELGDQIDAASTARFAPVIAQGLLGFVAAAYAEDSDAGMPAAEARFRVVQADIEARLYDPELAPAAVAARAGISPRRLRALFAEAGETFSGFLLRRRLERSAALLRDPAWRGASITAIAFRNGFNNPTHFGYAFKRRFGVTPREYRQAPA